MSRRSSALFLTFALVGAACGGGGGDDGGTTEPTSTTTVPTTTAAPTTTQATTTTTTEPPLPEITVRITGEEEIVFDYSESPCGTAARPDLPARAFRTGGMVSLVLPHEIDHRMTGADFDSLVISCDPIMTAAFDHDPAAHAHHEWIGATYVVDGVVHAVIHNEYHGYEAELADTRRDILNPLAGSGWQYLARRVGGTAEMTPAASGFTGGGLCTIDFWGAHPDPGCDAVSRWTSDRDGELVVDLDATKVGVGGDGVIVDLRVDGAVVWEETLVDGADTVSDRMTVTVSTGSTIDFGVNAIGDSSFDATEMRMVVTPDGERCTLDIWSCQLVELTAARSDDGGATFQRTNSPNDLIATPPGRYEHDAGFAARWQPSNIVAHPDGSYVMIVQLDEARDTNAQHSCLFRTTDLGDPGAWRGWDGESFSIAPIDAYRSDEVAPTCARVGPAPISGLVWSPELELFVASGGFAQFGTNGHHLLFSRDLFTWSDPVLVKPAEFVFTSDTPPFEPYGTLIDHASTSPSFDTIGSTPYYYFTRINDPSTLDFDLVRMPLEISITD